MLLSARIIELKKKLSGQYIDKGVKFDRSSLMVDVTVSISDGGSSGESHRRHGGSFLPGGWLSSEVILNKSCGAKGRCSRFVAKRPSSKWILSAAPFGELAVD